MHVLKVNIIVMLMFLTVFDYSITLQTAIKSNQNDILQCINKLYSQIQEPYTFIVSNLSKNNIEVIKNNSGVLISTIITNDSLKKISKYQMFILLVETIQQFENIMMFLSKTSAWNSRGKFLVGYLGQDDFGQIFNTSSKYYVMNINVITSNRSEVNIYTYFPFKDPYCGEYYGYEFLSTCDNDSISDIFPLKLPLDLHECEIKTMAYVIQPYVIDLSMPKEQPSKAGVEITIIHNVAKRMNFTLKFLKNPHKHWGYRFSDGSFSMMYKALKDRETDIIFGFTYGNSSYSKDFDASFCHLSDSSVWFFPTAPQIAQWKNLTNIFEPILWLAILLMLLINGIFWWIIGRTREPSDDYNDLVICIMSSMYVLLQGSVTGPKTWKVRLIFILWLMTCLLIFTAHQCQLISILTSDLYEHQMTTLDELVASRSEFGFYPTIEDAYHDPNPTNAAILQRYQNCPLTAECLNRTAFNRDYAVVKNRRQVLYFMPRYYTFPTGRPMLYDTDISAFSTRERYYVYKGFPLLERFDNILMLLAANGLIQKWDADARYYVLKLESADDNEPLSLGHLQGAFLVYMIGNGFAFFILLFEVVIGLCCGKVKNEKIKKKYKL